MRRKTVVALSVCAVAFALLMVGPSDRVPALSVGIGSVSAYGSVSTPLSTIQSSSGGASEAPLAVVGAGGGVVSSIASPVIHVFTWLASGVADLLTRVINLFVG